MQTVTAPGTIELIDEAKIASQTMGQVKTVHVEKGDRVKTGDLLVTIDDEDARARLESTEARIDRLKDQSWPGVNTNRLAYRWPPEQRAAMRKLERAV